MKEVENAEPKDDVNVEQECQREHDNLSGETDKNQTENVDLEEKVDENQEKMENSSEKTYSPQLLKRLLWVCYL